MLKKGPRPVPAQERWPRVNEKIRAREVRVIAEDGTQLGVMPPEQAIEHARAQGLDLIEIAPEARPPVCKVLDFGKYKYEQKKKKAESRKHQVIVEIKEIKFRVKIDAHDYEAKVKQIRKFLSTGDKVKVTVMFRGREITHKELGLDLLDKVNQQLMDAGAVEQAARLEGRHLSMLLAPKVSKAAIQRQQHGGPPAPKPAPAPGNPPPAPGANAPPPRAAAAPRQGPEIIRKAVPERPSSS